MWTNSRKLTARIRENAQAATEAQANRTAQVNARKDEHFLSNQERERKRWAAQEQQLALQHAQNAQLTQERLAAEKEQAAQREHKWAEWQRTQAEQLRELNSQAAAAAATVEAAERESSRLKLARRGRRQQGAGHRELGAFTVELRQSLAASDEQWRAKLDTMQVAAESYGLGELRARREREEIAIANTVPVELPEYRPTMKLETPILNRLVQEYRSDAKTSPSERESWLFIQSNASTNRYNNDIR